MHQDVSKVMENICIQVSDNSLLKWLRPIPCETSPSETCMKHCANLLSHALFMIETKSIKAVQLCTIGKNVDVCFLSDQILFFEKCS